jgi:hypothetical protein
VPPSRFPYGSSVSVVGAAVQVSLWQLLRNRDAVVGAAVQVSLWQLNFCGWRRRAGFLIVGVSVILELTIYWDNLVSTNPDPIEHARILQR